MMDTQYYVFIHRPGPNWLAGKPIAEQPLAGHFQYMNHLQSQRKLVLGGGFLDGSGAMGVLMADDMEQARSLVNGDPAVRDGIVTTEVHPWLVTVPGCAGTNF